MFLDHGRHTQTYLVAVSYSALHNVERIDHICGNWPQTCKGDFSFFFSSANLTVSIYCMFVVEWFTLKYVQTIVTTIFLKKEKKQVKWFCLI